MNIYDTIEAFENDAKELDNVGCGELADQKRQIAAWLSELCAIRSIVSSNEELNGKPM